MAGLGGREGGLTLRLLSWNLFHGRDAPPGEFDRGLGWLVGGRPEARGDYVLLNRPLGSEFGAVLGAIEWDVALLQEVPPRWAESLAGATGSKAHFVPTARNWMSPLTGPVWSRRPHLAGSWEGGGNMVLVRDRSGLVVSGSAHLVLTRLPERRVVQLVRFGDGPDLYNLHASTGPERAARDVLAAARFAVTRSGGRPFVLGGDLNCRPAAGRPFTELSGQFGLSAPPPGMSGAIDHLLARGLEVIEPPRALPPERREVVDGRSGRLVRLSDHPPVVALFEV